MKRVIIAALALAAMAGCNKVEGLDSYNDSANIVNFSSQSITRTYYDNGPKWLTGDKIGIFSDGFTDDYFNVAYKAESGGETTANFTLVGGETQILYPNAESGSVTFYAYYPYDSAAIEESTTVDISEQDDLGLIDFMTAAAKSVSYGSDVALTFEHKLAMVVFNVSLKDDGSITSLNGLKARMEGIETQGSYYTYGEDQGDLSGSLTAAEDVDLTVSVASGYQSATITAILHPATYTTPTLIFTLDGTEYVTAFAQTLGAGNSHSFGVSLGFGEATMGSPDIDDWDINDKGSLDYLDASEFDIAYNSKSGFYQIYTAEGLKAFANLVNGTEESAGATYAGFDGFSDIAKAGINGKLMDDIDLATVCSSNNGSWIPIGDLGSDTSLKYTGEFDGNGYEVQNIYINSNDNDRQGLFGYTYGAKIHDLGVVGGSVEGKSSVGGVVGKAQDSSISNCYNTAAVVGDGYVGGVVGYADDSSISGCYNTNKVDGSSSYVGGIAGYTDNSIINCYNMGEVEGDGSSVGGIVGQAHSADSSISGCYNMGKVTSGGSEVGGVVGKTTTTSTVTSCYSCGTVSSSNSSFIGGVVGANEDNTSTITYCYYDNETVDDVTSGTTPTYAVGSSIDSDPSTVKGLTTAEMQAKDVVLWLNNGAYINNETASTTGAWLYNSGGNYPTYDPTATPSLTVDIKYNSDDTLYEIYTAAGLKAFANLVNGTNDDAGAMTYGVTFSSSAKANIDGKLMDDIDLSTVCSEALGTSWIPIGNYIYIYSSNGLQYSGTFDGNGKVVKNIYINSDNSYQGLFGYVRGSSSSYIAEVKNLGVVGGSVKGNNNVGGVVGYSYSYSSISCCYNTATVKGIFYDVGGVVGYSYSNSSISNCYNMGDVDGSQLVGGVVGLAFSSTISDCYNMGNVTGSDKKGNIGGVVGKVTSSASVTSCYSCGTVSSSSSTASNIGGVLGLNDDSSSDITDCYYDNETVDVGVDATYTTPTYAVGSTASDTETVKGLSTADMTTNQTLYGYLNTASANTWTKVENSYPILIWQVSANE